MSTDELWMGQALALARRAEATGEVPVGAMLVRGGEMLGAGWNSSIGSHDPSAHAEIQALRDAARRCGNYRLIDTTLYVTLEPCLMCAGALVHARVERLVFGAYDPKAGVAGSRLDVLRSEWLNHRVRVDGGVLQAECAELLRVFFRARRRSMCQEAVASG